MKKIFIISSILLLTTLFFGAVYMFSFSKKTGDSSKVQTIPTAENSSKEQPSVPMQKIRQFSKIPVVAPVYEKATESILFYSGVDGTVWQTKVDGSFPEKISDVKLDGLKDVIWSPDRKRVITRFNKGGKDAFYEYDHVKNAGMKLKDNLDTVSWDNIGAKIIYKYYDQKTKQRSLNTADPDGKNWMLVADRIPFRTIEIAAVPLTSLISFWNFPNVNEESQLQVVGINGGEIKNVFKGRFGADYKWSPGGNKVLISSLEPGSTNKLSLGIVKMDGSYTALNVSTLVSKCVWSADNKHVFCAVPSAIPETSVMPNDYMEGKVKTEDTFWRIDTDSSGKEQLIKREEMKGNFDVKNPFLSLAEDFLLFVNGYDQNLYGLML